jgi:hypothetical protein
MKILAICLALLFVTKTASVYDFKLTSIDGKAFSLAKYKGKKNPGSKHGFKMRFYPTVQRVRATSRNLQRQISCSWFPG